MLPYYALLTVLEFIFSAPTRSVGWFFTTQADFENKNADFTLHSASIDQTKTGFSYIIVYGPLELINDDYYFAIPGREIPTDHYYASYSASDRGHGCDANRNDICGQYQCFPDGSEGSSVDGVNVATDVFVGRAPITSGDEAANFVNKVLLYEQLASKGLAVDSSYLSYLTFLCDDWMWPWVFAQTPAPSEAQSNPAEGLFGMAGKSLFMHIQKEPAGNLAGTLSKSSVKDVQPFTMILSAGETETVVPYCTILRRSRQLDGITATAIGMLFLSQIQRRALRARVLFTFVMISHRLQVATIFSGIV